MRRLFLSLLALAVIGAVGYATYTYSYTGRLPLIGDPAAWLGRKPPPVASATPAGPPGGPPAVAVEAAAVRVGPISQEITAVGTLRSNESVVIRPEVAGKIAQIQFREGDAVRKGAPLVTLDASVQRAELAQQRAALVLSRANNERAGELLQRGAGTPRARDEAIARLRNDEATVSLAEARLAKTVIDAPFDGVLGLRRVSAGDVVSVGQDLVNLEQIDPIKLDFRVPEMFLAALRPDQPLRIAVDAFPGRSFDGSVYAIDPLVDQQGRSVVIRAQLPNPGNLLRPGLFARVTLVIAERENAISVPEDAIVPANAGQSVFRIVDGRAVATPVKLGARRSAMVEVVEGLTPGATVVTAGQLKLRDGAPVRVVPTLAGAPAPARPGG